MSHRELSRLEIIRQRISKHLKQNVAADLLDMSVRQIQRLEKRYLQDGAFGLISKKRDKPSNHQISGKIKDEILSIVGSKYVDFGPTLAHEKLSENHNISISVETLRKLMINAGFWIPRNHRIKRAYQPRNRRSCYGELIQIDGSLHPWFEGRGPKCSLLVYIDDATSTLMTLFFAPSESMHTYFLATDQYIKEYGKPVAFYSDKFGVFRVNSKASNGEVMTQFCRGLYELNIDLIYANSPQAKGRVERANKTLQDRLVKELRLRGISDIETANCYMKEFKTDYNKRFAKLPLSTINAHRPLQPHEHLKECLCFKTERTLTHNLTVQHDRILYLIEDTVENRLLKRKKIDLHEYPDGHVELFNEGKPLKFRQLYDRVLHESQSDIVPNKRIDEVINFIKKNQEIRTTKRSNSAPTKRHLGIIPPAAKQPAIIKI